MGTLEAVVKSLNEAVGALKTLTTKSVKTMADAELLAADAKAKLALVDEARKDLELREKIVAGKESALLSGEDLAALKDALAEERTAFENEKRRVLGVQKARDSELEQKASDLQSREKDLLRREKELLAEKEAYKDRVLDQIKKMSAK